jgi:hypothetical protein
MKTLRRKTSTYAISLILCLGGIAALLTTLWKTWPEVSSAKAPFSTFLTLLWNRNLSLIWGLEFKLVYLLILGDAMLILGVVLLVLSVQRFYLPGKIVWYRCPFCEKDWRSSGDKALVHCPHCRQLIHPIIIEKSTK